MYDFRKKGKKYNENGNLIFEGEYLRFNRWNGKGYDNNGSIIYELNNGSGNVKEYTYYYGIIGKELIFEGEISYGKLWNGIGKKYYEKDQIEIDVEIKKGGINKYKEYFENGRLRAEKEFLNEALNGKGKEYNENGQLIFEGEYLNNKRVKGKEYNEDGQLIYEGEYINGKRKLK